MPPPLAYLLTFCTYGSWLHGDARGSRHHRDNAFPALPLHHHPLWAATERAAMKHAPVSLDPLARALVERLAMDVCKHNEWTLLAVNARVQHVHVVVGAEATASVVMRSIKAWTSRRLAEDGAVRRGGAVWARHVSTRYLWTRRQVERAVRYVVEEQEGGEGEGVDDDTAG